MINLKPTRREPTPLTPNLTIPRRPLDHRNPNRTRKLTTRHAIINLPDKRDQPQATPIS